MSFVILYFLILNSVILNLVILSFVKMNVARIQFSWYPWYRRILVFKFPVFPVAVFSTHPGNYASFEHVNIGYYFNLMKQNRIEYKKNYSFGGRDSRFERYSAYYI